MNASKFLARPFVVALGIAAFAVVPANAADVVFQEPPSQPAPPMQMAPVATWTGPYVGLNLGYGFAGRVSNAPSLTDRVRTRGFLGGAFVGYTFQDGMMVYGGEADLNYARFSGTNAGGDSARARIDGSLRARLGVAVNEDILLYGTGGVAAERLRVTPAAVNTNSDTNMMVGLTGGVGMDARLTDQVFGRIEYRYTHYGSRNFNFGAGNESINSRNHRVTAGIGVRF